ncbi:MAG: DUF4920 domain-containing protein [Bacteroidales bacterium]|nr:DUF4920 domain-containing protein [Bacteroidales bacterium]
MKISKFILLLGILAACTGAPRTAEQAEVQEPLPSTGAFGMEVNIDEAIDASAVADYFADSDTLALTVSGGIAASCKYSGCWMDIDMGNGETIHVTFLDDDFSIPLDASGKYAIAKGTVIRRMIPVETLQNFARDEGQREEDIALITEPAWAYKMIATVVIIEE